MSSEDISKRKFLVFEYAVDVDKEEVLLPEEEMLPEYDFSNARRGCHMGHYGTNYKKYIILDQHGNKKVISIPDEVRLEQILESGERVIDGPINAKS